MRLRPPGIDRYEVPPGVDPAAWRGLQAEDRRTRPRPRGRDPWWNRSISAREQIFLIAFVVATGSLSDLFPISGSGINNRGPLVYPMALILAYANLDGLVRRWVRRSRSTLETVTAACCAVAFLLPVGLLVSAAITAGLLDHGTRVYVRRSRWFFFWSPFTSEYPENLAQVVPGVTAFCVAAAVALVVAAVASERRRRAALRYGALASNEPGCGGTVTSRADADPAHLRRTIHGASTERQQDGGPWTAQGSPTRLPLIGDTARPHADSDDEGVVR